MLPIAVDVGRASLITRFAAAGLLLELTSDPIGRGNPDVFGMDIQRRLKGRLRVEYFRIWPGHEENRIAVQGTDPELSQLVLLVHEPARVFEEYAPKHAVRADDPRIVRRERFRVLLRLQTDSRKRHYLCGLDERQLFIAELPRGVPTVRDAHRVLKAEEVLLAEGKRRVRRQGEWFFLELTPEERKHLERALAQGAIVRKQAIGGGGNPHTADEITRIPAQPLEHGHPVRALDVFVRGRVRHVDHKTLVLSDWHKVVRNTEPNAGRMAGIAWID
jgi:hypothetical protein